MKHLWNKKSLIQAIQSNRYFVFYGDLAVTGYDESNLLTSRGKGITVGWYLWSNVDFTKIKVFSLVEPPPVKKQS